MQHLVSVEVLRQCVSEGLLGFLFPFLHISLHSAHARLVGTDTVCHNVGIKPSVVVVDLIGLDTFRHASPTS